jgi:hypothetical protein
VRVEKEVKHTAAAENTYSILFRSLFLCSINFARSSIICMNVTEFVESRWRFAAVFVVGQHHLFMNLFAQGSQTRAENPAAFH